MSSSDHTSMPSLPSAATLPSAYGGTMSMPPSLVLQFAAAPSNTQHNAYGSGHGNTLSQSSYAPIHGLLSAAHQLGGFDAWMNSAVNGLAPHVGQGGRGGGADHPTQFQQLPLTDHDFAGLIQMPPFMQPMMPTSAASSVAGVPLPPFQPINFHTPQATPAGPSNAALSAGGFHAVGPTPVNMTAHAAAAAAAAQHATARRLALQPDPAPTSPASAGKKPRTKRADRAESLSKIWQQPSAPSTVNVDHLAGPMFNTNHTAASTAIVDGRIAQAKPAKVKTKRVSKAAAAAAATAAAAAAAAAASGGAEPGESQDGGFEVRSLVCLPTPLVCGYIFLVVHRPEHLRLRLSTQYHAIDKGRPLLQMPCSSEFCNVGQVV
jgi:hypothetical protein